MICRAKSLAALGAVTAALGLAAPATSASTATGARSPRAIIPTLIQFSSVCPILAGDYHNAQSGGNTGLANVLRSQLIMFC
jgi:hypothetical protein